MSFDPLYPRVDCFCFPLAARGRVGPSVLDIGVDIGIGYCSPVSCLGFVGDVDVGVVGGVVELGVVV